MNFSNEVLKDLLKGADALLDWYLTPLANTLLEESITIDVHRLVTVTKVQEIFHSSNIDWKKISSESRENHVQTGRVKPSDHNCSDLKLPEAIQQQCSIGGIQTRYTAHQTSFGWPNLYTEGKRDVRSEVTQHECWSAPDPHQALAQGTPFWSVGLGFPGKARTISTYRWGTDLISWSPR